MSGDVIFDRRFEALTGRPPFAWQRRLYTALVDEEGIEAVDVPTGLGKTNTIAVWLLALAAAPENVPRRLVYVVNRRTVVDQSTREVEKFVAALETPGLADVRSLLLAMSSEAQLPGSPVLAISTLRGQLADNGGWRQDPSRPAIVLGTVDMVGSRLLFSGYGVGFRSRALHAGLLGKDTLLVHDEAHLEPAFQELLTAIAREQERTEPARAMRVLALTATPRGSGDVVQLDLATDLDDPVVAARYFAYKALRLISTDDVAVRMAAEARALAAEGAAVLVFVRTLELLEKVSAALIKAHPGSVAALTGTMRGRERERLVSSDPVFRRFDREGTVESHEGPAFLVATSAGEVGVNISADHLVCDLSTWDSMAQRLGRVNRFGGASSQVRVVLAPEKPSEKVMDKRLARTAALLATLPVQEDGSLDASPAGLSKVPRHERIAAFSPEPVILPTDDVFFDALAMTTPRDLPGRPPVADWLHGKADWEPPTTAVAWRAECDLFAGRPDVADLADILLKVFPLKPHELLQERSDRVLKQVAAIVARVGRDEKVWVIDAAGALQLRETGWLVTREAEDLRDVTLVLPPSLGGLTAAGLLDGRVGPPAAEGERPVLDVGDDWGGGARLRRMEDGAEPPTGMRRVARFDLTADPECEAEPSIWTAWVRPAYADDDGSRDAVLPQTLRFHLAEVRRFAEGIAERVGIGTLAPAVVVAAAAHDLGKDRAVWQRAIGNVRYPGQVLAKSGGKGALLNLGRYRHEFGSLHDVEADPEFGLLSPEARELALHLIAAHHGRARPGFPPDEGFDPGATRERSRATALSVVHRFESLQRKHGRWGLAWLEALVRAADALGSQVAAAPEEGR